ncbi:MAG TPA: hypothetical protein VLF09_03080 [Cellvibrio sp.]|nr:hypothetical protein [Cellvibrio sp.]
MCSIGIHPNFKARYEWMYANLVRDAAKAGFKVVSGQYDHLVAPHQTIKAPTPPPTPAPIGGGMAA